MLALWSLCLNSYRKIMGYNPTFTTKKLLRPLTNIRCRRQSTLSWRRSSTRCPNFFSSMPASKMTWPCWTADRPWSLSATAWTRGRWPRWCPSPDSRGSTPTPAIISCIQILCFLSYYLSWRSIYSSVLNHMDSNLELPLKETSQPLFCNIDWIFDEDDPGYFIASQEHEKWP